MAVLLEISILTFSLILIFFLPVSHHVLLDQSQTLTALVYNADVSSGHSLARTALIGQYAAVIASTEMFLKISNNFSLFFKLLETVQLFKNSKYVEGTYMYMYVLQIRDVCNSI